MSRAERRAEGRVAKLPYVANATNVPAEDVRAASRQVRDLVDQVVAEVNDKLAAGWDEDVVLAWLSSELAKQGPEATATLAAAAMVHLARRGAR